MIQYRQFSISSLIVHSNSVWFLKTFILVPILFIFLLIYFSILVKPWWALINLLHHLQFVLPTILISLNLPYCWSFSTKSFSLLCLLLPCYFSCHKKSPTFFLCLQKVISSTHCLYFSSYRLKCHLYFFSNHDFRSVVHFWVFLVLLRSQSVGFFNFNLYQIFIFQFFS